MKPLRPYQEEAIVKLRLSLARGRRRPVLQSPTGSGKTRLAAEIINLALGKGNQSIFCVPAISLIDQTVKAFFDEGIRDIGVLQGDHPLRRPGAAVQVASVQTLPNRKMPAAKLIIVDECHKRFDWVSKQMAKGGAWERVPVIGLSATPWTKGLGRDFDDLIVVATMAELIPEFLAPFRVFAPSHPDLSDVRTVAGDYHEGELAAAMNTAPLIADAVTTWLEKGEGRPTLCFAVDRAHAAKLRDEFAKAGVPAEYADAYTPREERTRVGVRLRAGETKVLCNVGIATTGVDWPWVSCISYCRPTQSEMLWVQIVGRMLRKHPGKADALLFDHTDTALRLGLPTDIHFEKLDDGKPNRSGKKKPKKKPLPKQCPACGVVKPAGVHKCPACGFAPAKQSELEFADGSLTELRRGPEDREGPSRAERQRFYAMLLWQATRNGYKPGWCYHKYAEKYGHPPGRDVDRGCQPVEPDAAMRNWLKSRAIAWAKARQKRAA